jgi:hypothetical protein
MKALWRKLRKLGPSLGLILIPAIFSLSLPALATGHRDDLVQGMWLNVCIGYA